MENIDISMPLLLQEDSLHVNMVNVHLVTQVPFSFTNIRKLSRSRKRILYAIIANKSHKKAKINSEHFLLTIVIILPV